MVEQMIMGAGKTTVVCPLLCLMLADGRSLVMQVVPPALLEFSRSMLRSRFSSILHKRVYTLNFERSSVIDSSIVCKLENAASMGAIVVSTPSAVKSYMLKFIEDVLIANDAGEKSRQEAQKEVRVGPRVFHMRREGVCIIDEVDVVLHPLKSELNFPIGRKEDLRSLPRVCLAPQRPAWQTST